MMKFNNKVYNTKPLMPDFNSFEKYLKNVWENQWLTNNGENHTKLEDKLCDYLKVKNLSLFNNGTIALLVAIRLLDLKGKVITTPFTFPATTHALEWMGIEPVFCDINKDDLNINPELIEKLISSDVSAIMPVHVFGNPCDVHAIKQIADAYNLKVIYDGAHVFGTELEGQGIGTYGDATMYSFHATKLFHTAEGGGLAFKDQDLKLRCDVMKNFGILPEGGVTGSGINGKMNELQAAMGLAVLDIINDELIKRESISRFYNEKFSNIDGIYPVVRDCDSFLTKKSNQYYIVRVVKDEFGLSRDEVFEKLKEFNVFTRRYFHPLCSSIPCYSNLDSALPEKLPVASRIVDETIAIPFYGELGLENAEIISDIIMSLKK